jgi:hypothetical protein
MAMVKPFLFVLTAFLLGACYCSGPITIYENDLEKQCGALPCGVTLLNGSASIVTTYHAGEHGIRLETNSAVRIDRDASTSAPLKVESQLQVLFLCDEGTSFDVVLGSEDATGPTEVTLTGMVSPKTDTGEIPVATFVIPVPGPEVSIRPQLRFLQFTTIGPGGCTLGGIWVYLPNLCQG